MWKHSQSNFIVRFPISLYCFVVNSDHLGAHQCNLCWRPKEKKRWGGAEPSALHEEGGCIVLGVFPEKTCKQNIHHTKLYKWDHLLTTCLADNLHLILFKKVDIWQMVADNTNSKVSRGVPALITTCIVVSSLWQQVDFHISSCILICWTFQIICRKYYEKSPVRTQKVEETGR